MVSSPVILRRCVLAARRAGWLGLAVLALLWAGAPGALAQEDALAGGGGGKLAERQTVWPNGNLQARWTTLPDDKGEPVRHGMFRRYHDNGKLSLEAAYDMGRPTGTWRWFDPTGNMIRARRYEWGYEIPVQAELLETDLTTFTTPMGQVTAKGKTKQGRPHGPWQYFYPQGQPKAEGLYVNGAPEGRWVYYHQNGQVEQDVYYNLGVLHGAYRISYPDGADRVTGRMDQGLRHGLWRELYPNGQKKTEGRYLDGQREGEWDFYDQEGKPLKRVIYRAGKEAEFLPLPPPPEGRKRPVVPDYERVRPSPRLFTPDGQEIAPKE